MMGRNWIVVLGLALLAGSAAAEEVKPELRTDADKLSYGMGVYAARNFIYQGIKVDQALLIQGIKDGLAGDKLLMPEKDLRKRMSDYQMALRLEQRQTHMQASERNRDLGRAYLSENKAKPGVVTLATGVQYKVDVEGRGRKPGVNDTIVVNYRGALVDGTEFDSSEQGRPATFKLEAMIPGWKDVLPLVPAGSKVRIVVPPDRAYGERGAGHDVGPNATLVFDVELVAVN